MRSVDDLLEEAKWGNLTDKEIAYVVSEITSSTPGDDKDLCGLIFTLGRALIGDARAAQYRKLVEKFLIYPSDSMISRIAFITLCDCWKLSKEYLKQMKEFIKGVDWDDDDVRLVAISTAGEYLKHTFDKELLELLIQTFEATLCSSKEEEIEDEIAREVAYKALARIDGWNWGEIPLPNIRIIGLLEKGQLDLTPIENAKKKIKAAQK